VGEGTEIRTSAEKFRAMLVSEFGGWTHYRWEGRPDHRP
jgi:hypothetical protein